MSFASLYNNSRSIPGRRGEKGEAGLNFYSSNIINNDLGILNETLYNYNENNLYKKGSFENIFTRSINNYYNSSDIIQINTYSDLFNTIQQEGRQFDIRNTINIGVTTFNVTSQIKIFSSNGQGQIIGSNTTSIINVQSDSTLIDGITIINDKLSSIIVIPNCLNYSNENAFNNQIINCNIQTNEFGIVSINRQIYIYGNTFVFYQNGTNPVDSHRFIQLASTTNKTIIHNNEFIGHALSRILDLTSVSGSNYNNGIISFCNNKGITYIIDNIPGITYDSVNRLITHELNMNPNTNFRYILKNNEFTINNVYMYFSTMPYLQGISEIILDNNIMKVSGITTSTSSNVLRGNKGMITFDAFQSSLGITSNLPIITNYNNEYPKKLREDFKDVTIEENNLISYTVLGGATVNQPIIRTDNNWVNTYAKLNNDNTFFINNTINSLISLNEDIERNIIINGTGNGIVKFILSNDTKKVDYSIYKINTTGEVLLSIPASTTNNFNVNGINYTSDNTLNLIISGESGKIDIKKFDVNSYMVATDKNIIF